MTLENAAPPALEKLEEDLGFALGQQLDQLSDSLWENLCVSFALESMATSDVGMRISRNIKTLLSSFFAVKSLWLLECKSDFKVVVGSVFRAEGGKLLLHWEHPHFFYN